MRSILCLILLLFAGFAHGQSGKEVYATATGHTYTQADLSPDVRTMIINLPAKVAEGRTQLLDSMINDALIDIEAKARTTTSEKLVAGIISKVVEPTEAEVKAVYEANLAALEGKPLESVRASIVSFLKQERGQKMLMSFVETLKAEVKVVRVKDVNAKGLRPTEVLVNVGASAITVKQFEEAGKVDLYEAMADVSDIVTADLDGVIFDSLLLDEAKSLNIDPSDLRAREVTDKMKTFSDEERLGLEQALRSKLFTKYKVKILYKEPEPPVENISVDDDPAQGPAVAPVTIVMFSDFQCSACSATHPVLKKAMAAFPGKIRFVVRDFPLTNIHKDAYNAALAAGAANAQGKFFEYTELLYQRQDALDADSLKKYAGELGLNVRQFEIDFNSEKTAAEVRKDMADGEQYRIHSTPTIFVGGIRVRRLSVDGFRKAIERALAK